MSQDHIIAYKVLLLVASSNQTTYWEVFFFFLDVDFILLSYSDLVKENVVDIHNMLPFSFFFMNIIQMSCKCYYIGCINIDICKNQYKN